MKGKLIPEKKWINANIKIGFKATATSSIQENEMQSKERFRKV